MELEREGLLLAISLPRPVQGVTAEIPVPRILMQSEDPCTCVEQMFYRTFLVGGHPSGYISFTAWPALPLLDKGYKRLQCSRQLCEWGYIPTAGEPCHFGRLIVAHCQRNSIGMKPVDPCSSSRYMIHKASFPVATIALYWPRWLESDSCLKFITAGGCTHVARRRTLQPSGPWLTMSSNSRLYREYGGMVV